MAQAIIVAKDNILAVPGIILNNRKINSRMMYSLLKLQAFQILVTIINWVISLKTDFLKGVYEHLVKVFAGQVNVQSFALIYDQNKVIQEFKIKVADHDAKTTIRMIKIVYLRQLVSFLARATIQK